MTCDCGLKSEHEPRLYDFYGQIFKCEGIKAKERTS
jgi:hypothetical protein